MLEKITDYKWKIPQNSKPGQKVPGIIFISEKMLKTIQKDNCLEQVANVACLPGVEQYSLAMPDIHWGYGFPIGGVAATDIKNDGVISPGGVGYDINCGVMLLKSSLDKDNVVENINKITGNLFYRIPTGVGSKGNIKLNHKELKKVLNEGAKWAVQNGFGNEKDLLYMEEQGCLKENEPELISDRAQQRGMPQLGTLGSGNHFIEIQMVEKIFEPKIAQALGLKEDMITVMIHSGSRGLGYQVCDDNIRKLKGTLQKYKFIPPDKQLVCTPFESQEGREYFLAMNSAANYAWANRLCMAHLVRKTFQKTFSISPKELNMDLLYDVAHNIAKIEEYEIAGKIKKLCVHRKGATRAFPKGSSTLPDKYKSIGQPVIVPGDMGRSSYVLVGTKRAQKETFSSVCHGAGRLLSRHEAVKTIKFDTLSRELQSKGIAFYSQSKKTLLEEAPQVYKDVNEVVDVVAKAGIGTKVARMKPLGVIKG